MLWAVASLWIVVLAASCWEVPVLYRQRSKKELGVFLAAMFVGASFTTAVILEVPMPGPYDVLRPIFGPIGYAVRQYLKGSA